MTTLAGEILSDENLLYPGADEIAPKFNFYQRVALTT
jgi:hypothetical protein